MRRPAGSLLVDALLRDWSTKAAALLLAVILFVITRNDVTRTFRVPVRVKPDVERVLLTDVPSDVQVEVRGPWSRVNRLQAMDLGSLVLDLSEARPGPLEIDPGGLVMPPGVILGRMIYDPVDLRFEAVIERELPVRTPVSGAPDPDFEVSRVIVEPPRWTVRGGRSAVLALHELRTEVLDVTGATGDVEREVELVDPPAGTSFLHTGAEAPRVKARAVVAGITGVKDLNVPVEWAGTGEPPISGPQPVKIIGPVHALRRLEGITDPVVGRAVEVASAGDGPPAIEIRMRWRDEVPAEVRALVEIDPALRRIPLPTP